MPTVPDPFRQSSIQRPELSRKVQLTSLGRQDGVRRPLEAQETIVEATGAECTALARRLGVPAVGALRCRFRLSAVDQAGRVHADGLLTATLTRICVASLDEFEDQVVEAFSIRFVPDDLSGEAEDSLDPDADDDVPYEGTSIDLGEAAVEQLALAMQPYPRKPGVDLPNGIGSVDVVPGEDGSDDATDNGNGRPNPFAVLKPPPR